MAPYTHIHPLSLSSSSLALSLSLSLSPLSIFISDLLRHTSVPCPFCSLPLQLIILPLQLWRKQRHYEQMQKLYAGLSRNKNFPPGIETMLENNNIVLIRFYPFLLPTQSLTLWKKMIAEFERLLISVIRSYRNCHETFQLYNRIYHFQIWWNLTNENYIE